MLERKRQKIQEAADREDAESVDDAAVVDDMFDFLSDMSTTEQSQSGPTLFKDLPAPKNIQGFPCSPHFLPTDCIIFICQSPDSPQIPNYQ